MQGCVVRSWTPLGLLLVCLHFPGLFSRSISVVEEKAPQHLSTNLPLPEQPPLISPSNSEHPQPQPGPVSEDFTRASLMLSGSPADSSQPIEGPEAQGWPLSEGPFFVNSWSTEDPWWMMAAADEDYGEGALPEDLSFYSSAEDLPQGSRPSSAGPSPPSTGASPDTAPLSMDSESRHPAHSNVLGALEPTFRQRPFWSFINKIRQALLSGRPCGILNPRVPVVGRGPGTGWGTRPMPNPVGIGGINNQNPNAGWGNVNMIPGGIWENVNGLPGNSWENINQFPGNNWGPIRPVINKLPHRVLHPPNPSLNIPPGLSKSKGPASQ
ncbi:uncharacterized protein C6orf15 homolog [Suncus etruscus]|uniref:uncharacterized protein C6orf15 homolog n=1 Tax=Suncus etruscus TaxID=109475 RepID=UPI00211000B0|nr:uncharacterized protein C6orf15 homolog [Suncus etruscus]